MRIFSFTIVLLLALLAASPCLATEPPADGLPAALQAALTHHPAIRGKKAELAAQGFAVATAKAGRYPGLSGQVSKQDDGSEQGSLRLRQPLWAFGKIDTPIARARARHRAETVGQLQLQRQLVEQTAAVYARVQGARRQLQVADDNIAEHQRLYQRIERRRAGQLASDADVRLAFSRLTQAESQRERLAGELRVATATLRALTQVEVETAAPVDQALSSLPGQATIKQRALQQSADILYKRQLIEVAKWHVAMEKVASNPALFVQAEHDFLGDSHRDDTRIGLTIEGQIVGAGLGIVNRVRSADAQLDAARQDLLSTRNDVELRISTLLTNLALQARLQRSQQTSVAAIGETMASFLRQYDSGRKSWLDVLNIQRELTEQRLQLARADSDWLSYSLRIAALIGRLDQAAGIEAASH